MRQKLSFANVVSVLALFVALGGSAYAFHLGRDSVGSKQLKKSAVTTAKVKKEAITAAKVKKATLTGKQIDAATLGTVPTARAAETASGLAAPEAWHEVGTAGEPRFLGGWQNQPGSSPFETVAFYKDHEGVVHLRGSALTENTGDEYVFALPPGFRPAPGKSYLIPGLCYGPPSAECVAGLGGFAIHGLGSDVDGGVHAPSGSIGVNLDGMTFRAEG
jgi:hypothetical protein